MTHTSKASHSLLRPWTVIVLVLMFLTVAVLNQTPSTKDLTNNPTSEALLEANATNFFKKTYKVPEVESFYFTAKDEVLWIEESFFKEIERQYSDHFYSIDRINSKYSNIPPPSLA